MLNKKGRLFTFGCSFTNYKWPTWADILGREYEYFENWGKIGCGNKYIFHSLIECNQKNKFTPDDTIIIMWTGTDREDRYIKNMWNGLGSVYRFYTWPKSYVKKYFDWRGNFLCDIGLITASADLLKCWKVRHSMLSMVKLNNLVDGSIGYDCSVEDDVDDIITLFKNSITDIKPSVFEVIFNSNWGSRRLPNKKEITKIYKSLAGADWPTVDKFLNKNLSTASASIIDEIFDNVYLKAYYNPHSVSFMFDLEDIHPVPIEHLEYLDKVIPEYKISDQTREWVNIITRRIIQKKSFNDLWHPMIIPRI